LQVCAASEIGHIKTFGKDKVGGRREENCIRERESWMNPPKYELQRVFPKKEESDSGRGGRSKGQTKRISSFGNV